MVGDDDVDFSPPGSLDRFEAVTRNETVMMREALASMAALRPSRAEV